MLPADQNFDFRANTRRHDTTGGWPWFWRKQKVLPGKQQNHNRCSTLAATLRVWWLVVRVDYVNKQHRTFSLNGVSSPHWIPVNCRTPQSLRKSQRPSNQSHLRVVQVMFEFLTSCSSPLSNVQVFKFMSKSPKSCTSHQSNIHVIRVSNIQSLVRVVTSSYCHDQVPYRTFGSWNSSLSHQNHVRVRKVVNKTLRLCLSQQSHFQVTQVMYKFRWSRPSH